MTVPFAREALSVPGYPLKESEIIAHCEQCDSTRRLSACKNTVVESERIYRCPTCADLLAVVFVAGDVGKRRFQYQGYLLGGKVFVPVVDITVATQGREVQLKAKENAILPWPAEDPPAGD